MKVNIKKLQNGGFASWVPIKEIPAQSPIKQTREQPEKAASSNILDDDIYKGLIGKGLINDVNSFVSLVTQLEKSGINEQGSVASLQIIAKLNEIYQNKDLWDKSLQISKESGGLSEIAVGTSGEVFTKDSKGTVKTISIQEYKRKPVKLLTVSELLNERELNPQLVNNRSIFPAIQTSIGLEKINANIKTVLDVISEFSEESERTMSKEQAINMFHAINAAPPTQGTAEALKTLMEVIDTPGEFFKVYSKEQSKRKNIDKALNYIWTTLGSESQNKLTAVAAVNGKSSPKDLLVDLLLTYTEPTLSTKITPVKGESFSSDGSSTQSSKSLTAFQMIHKGLLHDPSSTFNFNDPKLNILFKGVIGSKGKLVDQKDNAIKMTSLKEILEDFGYNRFLDTGEIYFGDKEVSLANQNNIIYDPSATSGRVYLPIVGAGSNKIDWESLKEFQELYQIYEANKNNWTKEEATEFFNNNNWDIVIDEKNGEKIIRDNNLVKPFLVTYGYTNSATGLTKDNKFISKLSGQENEDVKSLLEAYWTVYLGKKKIDRTPDKWGHKEKYYGGIITIPYEKSSEIIVDAIIGQGATSTVPTLGAVQARLRNKEFTELNTNTSALNLIN